MSNGIDWSKVIDAKIITNNFTVVAIIVLLMFIVGAKIVYSVKSDNLAAIVAAGFASAFTLVIVLLLYPQFLLWLVGAGITYLVVSTLVALSKHSTSRASIKAQERMHKVAMDNALQAGILAPQSIDTLARIHYSSVLAQVRTLELADRQSVEAAIRQGARLMGRRWSNGATSYYALLPNSTEEVEVTAEEADYWVKVLPQLQERNER